MLIKSNVKGQEGSILYVGNSLIDVYKQVLKDNNLKYFTEINNVRSIIEHMEELLGAFKIEFQNTDSKEEKDNIKSKKGKIIPYISYKTIDFFKNRDISLYDILKYCEDETIDIQLITKEKTNLIPLTIELGKFYINLYTSEIFLLK